ncbi:MAG: acyl-CoA dehydrogenase domain protein [Myxococcales bacterium]|nr:acyl-CoA dehydrogenase domain protein [Myxococcales bacterium]
MTNANTLAEADRAAILERLRVVIAEQIAPNARRYDESGEFPADNFAALGRAGLMGLYIPTAYGGLGGDHRLYSEVIRRLAKACASTAMLSVMHNTQYSPLVFHGTQRQREFFLPPTARGEWFFANAATEAMSGDSTYAPGAVPHSVLRPNPSGGFLLDAQKNIVSGSSHARWVFLACREESDSKGAKRAIFAPGLGHGAVKAFGEWNTIGMRATSSTGLDYRGCEIPDWHIFEPDLPLGQSLLPIGILGFCSVWIGIAAAACEATIAHVAGRSIELIQSERRAGGESALVPVHSTVARFESVQRQVSEMRVRVDAASALVDDLAQAMDRSRPQPGESIPTDVFERIVDRCLSSRVGTSETAIDVCRVGMRVCGARALQRGGLPLERLMRDALTAQVMGPTEDALKVRYGRRLLGLE